MNADNIVRLKRFISTVPRKKDAITRLGEPA